MSRPIGRHRRGWRRVLRRASDLLVLALVAPVIVPLVLGLALAVKLDSPGPAFWPHTRVGRGGRRFRLFKLRTMVEGAEERKLELRHLNLVTWPDFKVANDPRVTRVGKWLRRTSLDELPQLWNLLRGEMTLVGPRACSIDVSKYELWQAERLEVTPGIVGRWQAEGRDRVHFADRCRMDIRQIRTRSLVSDVDVAVKTVRSVLTKREDS